MKTKKEQQLNVKLKIKKLSDKSSFFGKLIEDTLKPFDDVKDKQQKCMKKFFLICKRMYILEVYSIHYTLR